MKIFASLPAKVRKLFRRRSAHLRLGRKGEACAAKLLRSKGMQILCRNWRCSAGEIDIVARDGAQIVFVEVKSRCKMDRFRPVGNLSLAQIKRIKRAGQSYVAKSGAGSAGYRFDMVEVVHSLRKLNYIAHHVNLLPEILRHRSSL